MSNYIFICEISSSIYFVLNFVNLTCQGMDISKYFRKSLGLRDNESRLFYIFFGNAKIHLVVSFAIGGIIKEIPQGAATRLQQKSKH